MKNVKESDSFESTFYFAFFLLINIKQCQEIVVIYKREQKII